MKSAGSITAQRWSICTSCCQLPYSWSPSECKRDVAAAKAFFRLAFRRQGRLPLKIMLDGCQASHRAAKEALDEHPEGNQCKIRSSKYLNNLIEQDHRSVKLRLGPMLGLKHFRQAASNSCIGSGRVSSNSVDWAPRATRLPRFGMRFSLRDPTQLPGACSARPQNVCTTTVFLTLNWT